ncbi:hypothetical protein M758_2G158100 [Ceratodon purpureus]|nr:hypothetical protein M758_2G158100 [Ceratodon purpureus]
MIRVCFCVGLVHSIRLTSAACGAIREKVRFEGKRAPAGLRKWAGLFVSSTLEEMSGNCGEWVV